MARSKAAPHKIPVTAAGKQLAQKSVVEVAMKTVPGKAVKTPQGPSIPAPAPPKGKKRAAPGTLVLREIKKYRESTELLLRKASFARVVKRVAHEHNADMKFQRGAMIAIQEAAESYLVGFFEDANLCALHAKRVTVKVEDVELTRRLRNQPRGGGRNAATRDGRLGH